MILILCSAADYSAFWARQELTRRGLPVMLATAEELERAPRWQHTIAGPDAWFHVQLEDGTIIRSDAIGAVVNRLTWVPSTALLATMVPGDRAYAAQEWWAFFLSWLRSIPAPMLNAPTSQGLCGRFRSPLEWALLASRAGLPVSERIAHAAVMRGAAEPPAAWPGHLTAAVVLGDAVFGPDPLPGELADACRRLARLAETDLLGVSFSRPTPGVWRVEEASPCPDLALGGNPLADALATYLSTCVVHAVSSRGGRDDPAVRHTL